MTRPLEMPTIVGSGPVKTGPYADVEQIVKLQSTCFLSETDKHVFIPNS